MLDEVGVRIRAIVPNFVAVFVAVATAAAVGVVGATWISGIGAVWRVELKIPVLDHMLAVASISGHTPIL